MYKRQDADSLLERLHMLEAKVAEGIPIQVVPGTSGSSGERPAGASLTDPSSSGEQKASSEDLLQTLESRFSPAEAEDLKKIAANWTSIVGQTAMPMQKFLQAARIAVSEDSSVIKLIFPPKDMGKNYFERDHQHNLDLLSQLVAEQTGKKVKFECAAHIPAANTPSNYIDLSKIHLPVTFE